MLATKNRVRSIERTPMPCLFNVEEQREERHLPRRSPRGSVKARSGMFGKLKADGPIPTKQSSPSSRGGLRRASGTLPPKQETLVGSQYTRSASSASLAVVHEVGCRVTIDRELWQGSFRLYAVPLWPCPACGGTSLQVNRRVSGLQAFTEETPASREKGSYDEPFGEGAFAAILTCSRGECENVVAVCGRFEQGPDWDKNGDDFTADYCFPSFFYPTLPIFRVPRECPTKISEEIHRAFAVYWCDVPACLNHIRTSVEGLLTHLKVRRSVLTKKGKRHRLSLNERIELLMPKYDGFKKALHALQWLGNAGSHSSHVVSNDALNGFALLEDVLNELFVKHSTTLKKLAVAIVKAKGPAKPRRPRKKT